MLKVFKWDIKIHSAMYEFYYFSKANALQLTNKQKK